MSAAPTARAIGLLRAGATPEFAWRDAFDSDTEDDGAPSLAGLESREALRAAGRLAKRTGAPLADVLVRIGEVERERRRADSARDAALAGPRGSARMLAWLPVAGCGFAVLLDPDSARILLLTPMGAALLLVGGGLWWAGRRWTRAMVVRAASAGRDVGEVVVPLALAEAAVAAGLDVRTAIAEVGRAGATEAAGALVEIGGRLGEGVTWSEVWRGSSPTLAPLERGLRSAWEWGASPGPTLRAEQEEALERARRDAEEAAGRLSAYAAAPLALCFLPAFMILGIAPLILALAADIGGAS